MSQPSTLEVLFNAALQDYKDKTGNSLTGHPFARQLQETNSVESISAILEEQARVFREFRDHGKLINSLKRLTGILCSPFISTVLGEGIGLVPLPPTKAIFTGFAILLAAVKDVSSSYDALVDLFASFERFLSRLSIYTEVPLTQDTPLTQAQEPEISLMQDISMQDIPIKDIPIKDIPLTQDTPLTQGIPLTQALKNVLVEILVELLSTLALATKQVKQGRFKKFVKKLRGENDIEATIQRLDRLTLDEGRATAAQTLQVIYGLVRQRRAIMSDTDGNESAATISRALETIQEIVRKVNEAERDRIQRDVRDWLSPPDPWKNHNLARKSRHSGTGTWWIESDTYVEWKSSGPSSLLWIHGKPGAGKSIICSTIIEDIRASQKLGLASFAFFYFDFRDDQKKGLRGLLTSLLVQLGDRSDAYSAILYNFYVTHGRGSQHAGDCELLECLKNMLRLSGQPTVHIIIDAIDECPIMVGLPSPREEILELVEELVNLHVSNLRICVTSRPEADIVSVLGRLAFRSVSLHGEKGQIRDIAEYIKFQVRTDFKMRTWRTADKELVIDVLTKRANGMFRWTFCQLAHLRHCLQPRIRRALDELPATLDETYARALEDIGDQNWEYAHRLFQCVSAASRPLRVVELAEFLAFDFEGRSTPTFLADWRPEDPENTVISTCSSLLAVVNVDRHPVIQFAHFSVKEYLTSARLVKAKDSISRFHIPMTIAHTVVAQACLGVLLHLDQGVDSVDLRDFPLVKYAAKHLMDHARFENVPSQVQDGMKRMFDPRKHHFSVWRLMDHFAPPYDEPRSLVVAPKKARPTPLHYAASIGLHDIAAFLVDEHLQDINALDGNESETPLHVASREGHAVVAQLLLESGADVMAKDSHGRTPLHLASMHGHVEVAQILLKRGAEVDAKDSYTYSILSYDTALDSQTIPTIIIESTPLGLALDARHDDVARVLLEHDADRSIVPRVRPSENALAYI